MNNQEKIKLISQRDRTWADLRDKQGEVFSVLSKIPPSSIDVIIALRCLNLVCIEILLRKEEISEQDLEKIMNTDYSENALNELLIEGFVNFKKIEDEKVSSEEKCEEITQFRDKMWNVIIKEEERMKYLNENIDTEVKKVDNIILIYICVAFVCFDIQMQAIELDILEENY